MEWMNGRSLKSYKNTAKNQEINYKYNKDGIREEKNFNGEITKYYLENNHIIYEQRGNDTIYYLYDLTGLIGLRYQEENYYYIKNLQGDIIGMLDKNYNRIVSYEYDSWGKLLSIKDEQENEITDETNIGIINPFRYREYYYDTETGLYYLNSRYYNPVWGRFLNADGIIGANMDIHSYNLYAYVSNNSINSTDSNGNFAVAGAFGAFGPAGAFGLGVLLGYAAVKTAPAIIQVAKQVVETVVNTVQDIANELTKPRKKQEDNYHNVYVLRNHQTHKVEYVGRTLDLKATEYRHQNNPFRTNLDFEPVARNISSNTARGLEQALIVECRTLNRNREYPINNQINGVSSRNPRYQLYWDSAMMWRSENIFSCS